MQNNAPRHISSSAAVQKRRAARKKLKRKKQCRALLLFVLLVGAIFLLVFSLRSCATRKNSETQNTPAQTTSPMPDTATVQSDTTQTESLPAEPVIVPTFTADLSAYEMYMNPADRDAYLTLVNATHPLPADYVPPTLTDLVNTRQDGRATQKMELYAAKALEALFLEASAQGQLTVNPASGYGLSVMSAYRSYAYQDTLFRRYTQQEMAKNPALSQAQAEAITLTYSNRPGTSEHQLGLCVDMHDLSGADVSFQNSKSYPWLRENAWKFGFILRYPEDKVEQTSVSFEPWHYRYVGRYHAKRIFDAQLCLEEYIASFSANS